MIAIMMMMTLIVVLVTQNTTVTRLSTQVATIRLPVVAWVLDLADGEFETVADVKLPNHGH
jgi:Na+-translocating ferredoxin:NAD+ oxidoreductase RnfE subunit